MQTDCSAMLVHLSCHVHSDQFDLSSINFYATFSLQTPHRSIMQRPFVMPVT